MKRALVLRKSKAVSPIVATLLLILVSVAAATVLYVFVSGLTRQTEAGGTQYAQTQIVIESVILEAGDNTAKDNITQLYVRNMGSIEIPAGNWTVVVSSPNGTVINATTVSIDEVVPPAGVINLAKTKIELGSVEMEAGKVYVVKVISPTGSSDSTRVRAS